MDKGLPPKNKTVHFIDDGEAKHTGWHSGTRWHSYQKPYTKPNEEDFVVDSWWDLTKKEEADNKDWLLMNQEERND